jgi:hypothetical protein
MNIIRKSIVSIIFRKRKEFYLLTNLTINSIFKTPNKTIGLRFLTKKFHPHLHVGILKAKLYSKLMSQTFSRMYLSSALLEHQ